MPIAKVNIYGIDYIGAFAISTDSFAILGGLSETKEVAFIKENLEVDVARLTVNGSTLAGIYAAANSNAILLPDMLYSGELKTLREQLPNVRIGVLDTDLNAVRNNVLVNDKVAIVNPEFGKKEVNSIKDILDVEIIRMSIGGFETVGANNILTNGGMVANNRATDSEIERLKEIFGNVSQSTANTGSVSIGLCTVANTKGMLAGQTTTGYELANISDGLGCV